MKEFGSQFWCSFLFGSIEMAQAFGAVMCLSLVYFLVRGRRRLQAGGADFFLFLGALLAYHTVISLGAERIDRYYRPIMPLLCVFAAAGLFSLLKDVGKRWAGVALVIFVVLVYLAFSLRHPIRAHRREQVQAGRWLADHDPQYRGYVVSSYSQTVLYSNMQFLHSDVGREGLQRLADAWCAPKYALLDGHRECRTIARFLSENHWRLLRTFPERPIRVYRNPRWVRRTVRLPVVSSAGLEVGMVLADHQWQRVELQGSFSDPVIVAGLMSSLGAEPVLVRLRSVEPQRFEVRLQEWDHQDGSHQREILYYLVAERGITPLPGGGVLEADRLKGSSCFPDWIHRRFGAEFRRVPVVLSQVMSFNGAEPVLTRQGRISPAGFSVTMQHAEARKSPHPEEVIGYIAVEPGTYEMGPWQWEARVSWEPVAHVEGSFPTRFGAIRVRVEEECSADVETWHKGERFGYLAFGSAVAYLAQLQTCMGPDTARLASLALEGACQ